jgi:hypothetical protein
MFASITKIKIDLRLKVSVLNESKFWHMPVAENVMPRFYFNLASKDGPIPDDTGKELNTLHDACARAKAY